MRDKMNRQPPKKAAPTKFKTEIKEVGLGLRAQHYARVESELPRVPWFEALTENYMGLGGASGGPPEIHLERIRNHYPVVLHGVSLSIGSTDPLDFAYLKKLKELIGRFEPAWVSDHFCWSGVDGENLHDLLPLPFTEEAVEHVVSRIQKCQDYLGRRLVLENVSSYMTYTHSEMAEWEFIREVSVKSGCAILLDVNNVYVNSVNHEFDPMEFLLGIPSQNVVQMHLAGYSQHPSNDKILIDTHDHPVTDRVWDLYKNALHIFGQVPTLIEWDASIPEFEILDRERQKAQQLFDDCKNDIGHSHVNAETTR